MTHLKIEFFSRCHHRILCIPKTFHSDQILRSSRRPHVVAIIEFYPFLRLFIRTKFLGVVDGLILAETSLLIMLSGMQI